jgi:hypothetical protein
MHHREGKEQCRRSHLKTNALYYALLCEARSASVFSVVINFLSYFKEGVKLAHAKGCLFNYL